MTTMAGVISANRRVLGEPVDPAAPPHPGALTHSVADSHLRELCVSCHLGLPKTEWGPITQESRGGGCNACHLVYSDAATEDLRRYLADQKLGSAAAGGTRPPSTHPSFTPDPTNEHCFGCHSRSSGISLSYAGWNELRGGPPSGHPRRTRQLDDGRHLEYIGDDLHHARGLDCIDCHTSAEVMGSGARAARKSEQQQVGCADCHARRLATIDSAVLDPESRRLLALRGWKLGAGERVGATAPGAPLVNVVVDAQGGGQLRIKHSGPRDERRPLRPPAAACTSDAGHARLSCASCHSVWAPRCTSCHTEFDPRDDGFDHVAQQWVSGTWNETAGPFVAAPPTLAVRTHAGADGTPHGVIETAVPGMIMTFDRNRDPGGRPDVLFRRLYGLTFAHTVQRQPRNCVSCHADPVALGYGDGTLSFDSASARWRFTAAAPRSPHDGLPADAWIPFLQTRGGMLSTRVDVRPLDIAEQRRVLRVGACLTCHAGDSPVMQRALRGFDVILAQRSPRCVQPRWH